MNQRLDYEELFSKVKRLVVEAVTLGGQRSSATLEINVLNINDNRPSFNRDVSNTLHCVYRCHWWLLFTQYFKKL